MASRLQKIEEKRNKRQALFFAFLTLVLVFIVIFFGIPSLIRMAIFLSTLKSSGQAVEVKDNVAPIAPKLEPLREATNSANIKIKGYSEAGTTLKIYQNNDEIKETIADENGYFKFENIRLEIGKNQFDVKAIDTANNESKISKTDVVVFDNLAPRLEITEPTDKAEYFDEDKEILVAGETEENVQVNVNNFFALVDNEGNFAKKIQLKEGVNDIQVVAIDKAGNITSKSLSVTLTP